MGGGGGGGRRYFPSKTPELQQLLRDQAAGAEQQRLDGDTNEYLRETLSNALQRDPEAIGRRLDDIRSVLADTTEVDAINYGGSVAKHTYVDGISDVDALVIIDRGAAQDVTPAQFLDDFHAALTADLSRKTVADIHRGKLAITVTYKDGQEIQLLPAMRRGERISIPNPNGKTWACCNPQTFRADLTAANQESNGCLVPAIRIAKAIVHHLPEQKQLSGYHVESIAVSSMKGYDGPKTIKCLVHRIFDHGAQRVLSPTEDGTGQSCFVDGDLGAANSVARRVVSDGMQTVARRLAAARSVGEWKQLVEGE